MKTITEFLGSPLAILEKCGGYYHCPRDPKTNKRLVPLVGYAGRDEKTGRQYVGDVYANFAKAERHLPVLRYFAIRIRQTICSERFYKLYDRATGYCGAPEGGKALATILASLSNTQYIFPEKKIRVTATDKSREVSELQFNRHQPEKGELWWITEDVCNNFSTTAQLVTLIESFGASVAGIVCFLNRSDKFDEEYPVRDGLKLPIISVVQQIIPKYTQDDPFVAEDIAKGNVVWKPKDEWDRLAEAIKNTE